MSGWTPLTIRTDGKDGEKEWESSVDAAAEKRGKQRIAIEERQDRRALDEKRKEVWAELENETPALLRRQAD